MRIRGISCIHERTVAHEHKHTRTQTNTHKHTHTQHTNLIRSSTEQFGTDLIFATLTYPCNNTHLVRAFGRCEDMIESHDESIEQARAVLWLGTHITHNQSLRISQSLSIELQERRASTRERWHQNPLCGLLPHWRFAVTK